MAKEASFDVVSQVDMQEVDNAVNQTAREVATRYDLKDSRSAITLDKEQGRIDVTSSDDFHVKVVVDVLQSKLIKRKVSLKALSLGNIEPAAGGTAKQSIALVQGIDKENARRIVKLVKDEKLKAKVQIEGDKVRVFSKSKDILQDVIALVKAADFAIPLQFVNYR